ncbi:MAG: 2-dehydropantoate 2-reductase [Bradyrhizobiaceae bacterium]|nr:2-dehydropantoate 2-reductase [Bradyrhizobiaceae bacterium]
MRIAVMAAGAVGGYFGARLAAAGHDVVFFARGAHLDAIRKDGLRVESVRGDLHLKNAVATDTAAGHAPVDAVLFAVKIWDNENAAKIVKPLIGPDTRVVTAQNGIDTVGMIEPILGRGHVVPGLAQISALISRPGAISHTTQFHLWAFGHPDGHKDPVLAALAEAGKAAGVDFAISEHIERDLWIKFTVLVGLSSVTAASRQPIGVIRDDPDGRALLLDIMREVVAVGRARGVALDADYGDKAMAFADGVPPHTKASMAHDLDRGNRLELDWLAGRVVSLGRELGIPTPACAAIYAVLKPYRMGKPAAA